jgi:hypothetical protein
MSETNTAQLDRHLHELEQQGYTLIPDFLSPDRLVSVNSRFDEMLGSNLGRNNFEGKQTERIYTLVARHRVFQEIAEDPRIMALCDALFQPNYLLTASQAIVISLSYSPTAPHGEPVHYRGGGRFHPGEWRHRGHPRQPLVG